jgi:peptidoglycan hydrolase-like protein with peptidoglycan-binding domain
MSWRSAPSVRAALAEATRRWPGRQTGSDGTIGDAAHSARQSDHNPDANGVVHAFDLTHDPGSGADCNVLAAHLVAVRDARVKYIIWNRQISNPDVQDWAWRPYSGQNPHTHHMHVSVKYTSAAENDTSDWWDVNGAPAPTPPAPTPPGPPNNGGGGGGGAAYPGHTLQAGSRGEDVRRLQARLKERGWVIGVDGIFGPQTRSVVTSFQRRKGLVVDGIVGPKTWAKVFGP